MDAKQIWFVFDVESIGLHGEAFAVAGGVFQYGKPISEFFFAVARDQCAGTVEDRIWVDGHVPALEANCRSRQQMKHKFWLEWQRVYVDHPGILMAVECGWPVEARFLAECVDDKREDRIPFRPIYPLHEIASFMAAAGMDPMKTHGRLAEEFPVHDPRADARQSARLLWEAIAEIHDTKEGV